MVAPARNKVAAAAAIAAPDLEVIFMGISSIRKWDGASPRKPRYLGADRVHPVIVTRWVRVWLHGGPALFWRPDANSLRMMRARHRRRARFVSFQNDQRTISE